MPQVLLNGHKSRLTYGKSAYVTQDEVLVGTLSVRETLMYAALLRLPGSMTRQQKVGAACRRNNYAVALTCAVVVPTQVCTGSFGVWRHSACYGQGCMSCFVGMGYMQAQCM